MYQPQKYTPVRQKPVTMLALNSHVLVPDIEESQYDVYYND